MAKGTFRVNGVLIDDNSEIQAIQGDTLILREDDGAAALSIDTDGVVLIPTADINGGTIDGTTLGTNSAITEAQVDNLNINGNTISSTNTNGNIVLSPNGTGNVRADTFTNQAGTGAPDFPNGLSTSDINGGQIGGFRNLITNGAMQVAQRRTSFPTLSAIAATDVYTLDRWKTYSDTVVSGTGTYTVDQSTDSPDGFHFSTKLSCSTTQSSQDVNEVMFFGQDIEGSHVQHVKFFQSNPDTVTFSFWVKSNTTGTYAFTLKLSDNGSSQYNTDTRTYNTDFTIDSVDTWEKKTLSITLDSSTAETKVTGNGFSMGFIIWLAAGSSKQSASPEVWGNNTNEATNTITVDNFFDSTSNYFAITGVQLEMGSTATPFEHRPYETELTLCQRYCQVLDTPISSQANASAAGTFAYVFLNFHTPFRDVPSMSSFPGYPDPIYIGTGSGYIPEQNYLINYFDVNLYTTGGSMTIALNNSVSNSSNYTSFGATTSSPFVFEAEL